MKLTKLSKILTLAAAMAIATTPFGLSAQTTNKASTEKQTSTTDTEKAPKGGPFHGKLAALDKSAKTITVGKRTFQITSETKIKKAGKPGTLDDGIVGETVSGYVKLSSEGKLVASTVNFGPKNPTEPSDKAKASTEKEKQPK